MYHPTGFNPKKQRKKSFYTYKDRFILYFNLKLVMSLIIINSITAESIIE